MNEQDFRDICREVFPDCEFEHHHEFTQWLEVFIRKGRSLRYHIARRLEDGRCGAEVDEVGFFDTWYTDPGKLRGKLEEIREWYFPGKNKNASP